MFDNVTLQKFFFEKFEGKLITDEQCLVCVTLSSSSKTNKSHFATCNLSSKWQFSTISFPGFVT